MTVEPVQGFEGFGRNKLVNVWEVMNGNSNFPPLKCNFWHVLHKVGSIKKL